jgi:uncharacterized protein YbgA (DUF1722 family)
MATTTIPKKIADTTSITVAELKSLRETVNRHDTSLSDLLDEVAELKQKYNVLLHKK